MGSKSILIRAHSFFFPPKRLKRRIMSQMRCLQMGNCGISAILEGVVDFFNLIFGATKGWTWIVFFPLEVQIFFLLKFQESTEFWQSYLIGDVQDYFGAQNDLSTVHDFKQYFLSQTSIEESPALRLLIELSKKCSLNWGSLLDYYKAQVFFLIFVFLPLVSNALLNSLIC